MSQLEERIYRDAARAAAEIAPHNVPPLRLEGRSGRQASGPYTGAWSGVARRPATRRLLAPLVAAGTVAALVAVLVAVGHSSPPAHHRSSPLGSAIRSRPANLRVRTEALDWYFPASGSTYTDGLAFGWLQDKITAADIDPCLAAAGFPQPSFPPQSEPLYVLSFPSGQFPDLAQLSGHMGQQHYFTAQYLVLRRAGKGRQAAMDRAQARCTARYAGRVMRVNTAAARLQNSWLGIVRAIQNSAAVRATQPAFARCLEAHGVPASDATKTATPGTSDPLFYGFNSWADGLNQAATSTARYKADVLREDRVYLACAPPVVHVTEHLQLARRAEFFRQHPGQIARVETLAGELMS